MTDFVTSSRHWSGNTSNNSAPGLLSLASSPSSFTISDIVMLLILISATTGNCLLVLVLVRVRRLRKNIDKYILNLSLCDLSLVLLSIPPQLANSNSGYPLGAIGCKIIDPLGTMAVNSSVFTLLAIARERFQAIRQPLTFAAVRKPIWHILLTIHACSLILIIPYIATKTYVLSSDGQQVCLEHWGLSSRRIYTIVLALSQYFVPVPVMIVSYVLAWRSVQVMNNRFITGTMVSMATRSRVVKREQYSKVRYEVSNDEGIASMLTCSKSSGASSSSGNKYHTASVSSGSSHGAASAKEEAEISPDRIGDMVVVSAPRDSKQTSSTSRVSLLHASNRPVWLRRLKPEFAHACLPDSKAYLSHSVNAARMVGKRRAQTRGLLETFSVVVVIFIIFMLPSQILWIMIDFGNNGVHPGAYATAVSVALAFTYANSVLNPFVYGGLNKKFREDFMKLFRLERKRKFCTSRRSVKESIIMARI